MPLSPSTLTQLLVVRLAELKAADGVRVGLPNPSITLQKQGGAGSKV
jgi:hypothetical protein